MSAVATNGRSTPRVARVAEVSQESAEVSRVGLMDELLAIAAEVPKLTRNADGQIGGRTYKYVNLDSLLDAIVPILIAHDLVWVTRPTMTEAGQPALRYRLTHVPSGESEEDVMPLMGAQDSQGVGSALTYARRYALLAVLNLAPGEDDDGAGASVPVSAPQTREENRNAQPTAAPPRQSERQLTADQREKLIKPWVKKAGLTDGEFANVMLAAAGEEPREWSSEEHAAQTMGRLLDRLPMRLKDAVLEGIDAAAEAKR